VSEHPRSFSIALSNAIAEQAKVGFGAVPVSFKPLFLFINDLPLDLIDVSITKGRKVTDCLAA
jgi:hypothetical protein